MEALYAQILDITLRSFTFPSRVKASSNKKKCLIEELIQLCLAKAHYFNLEEIYEDSGEVYYITARNNIESISSACVNIQYMFKDEAPTTIYYEDIGTVDSIFDDFVDVFFSSRITEDDIVVMRETLDIIFSNEFATERKSTFG